MWVDRKKFEKLVFDLTAAHEALQQAQKKAYLIGIERDGRVNKFTFVRDGEVHQIETMGLLGDDMKGWKDKLLDEHKTIASDHIH